MSTQDLARPVRLPRRSRQGVVMGMDSWQLTCLTAAAIIVLIGVKKWNCIAGGVTPTGMSSCPVASRMPVGTGNRIDKRKEKFMHFMRNFVSFF